jgi:hypothetical protein
MYAWMMRPDTIPRGYAAWITQASKLGEGAVKINKQLVREDVADQVVKEEMRKFMNAEVSESAFGVCSTFCERSLTGLSQRTTKWNVARIKDELKVIEGSAGKEFIYPFASCAVIHPWVDGCWMAQLDKFWEVGSPVQRTA